MMVNIANINSDTLDSITALEKELAAKLARMLL